MIQPCVKLLTAVLAVVAILVSQPALQADELISNSGFESAIVGPGTDEDNQWNWFTGDASSTASNSSADPLGGSFHLDVTMVGDENSFVGVQQRERNITVGEDYTFGFFARRVGDLGVIAEFRIEWLNDADGFVGDQFVNNEDITGSLTEDYQFFSQTHAAPVEATQLKVVFALQSFGAGDNTGVVYVDNATLDGIAPVPEPSALGFLSLSMVGLIGRRRRR